MKIIQVKNPDNLKTIDYKNLKPLQGDLKRIITDEAKAKLRNSILKHGFFIPAFVWKNNGKNYILDAHQRQKVLWELEKDGYEIPKIPIVEIQARNRKDAAEKLLQINSRYAEINPNTTFFDDFDLDLDILNDIEIPELDFDILQGESEGLTDDDAIPEEVEPICKTGDLWQLGSHRLLCGDATKKKDVEKLMNGKKADMVFTDPPYGMNYDPAMCDTVRPKGEWCNKPKNYKPIIGDDKQFDPTFIFEFFKCKEIFLWGADYYSKLLLDMGSWIVWDKRAGIEDVQWTTSEFELCWSKNKHHKQIARIKWHGLLGMEKDDTKSRIHPTQKPVLLAEWFFDKYKGNIVVDLFIGSGTTLIACEKTNRICYACEIDSHYVDVAIQRYVDYTGNNKLKLNGKDFIWEK